MNKFIVIKNEDVNKYLSNEDRDRLNAIRYKIMTARMRNGSTPANQYAVVNLDEPYAKEITDIMKSNGHWDDEEMLLESIDDGQKPTLEIWSNHKINFKDYTREEFVEFLEETRYGNRAHSPAALENGNPLYSLICPGQIKLRESLCNSKCEECWLYAIRDVEFKDEV